MVLTILTHIRCNYNMREGVVPILREELAMGTPSSNKHKKYLSRDGKYILYKSC